MVISLWRALSRNSDRAMNQLRRQRSQVRILMGAPFNLLICLYYFRFDVRGLFSALTTIETSPILRESLLAMSILIALSSWPSVSNLFLRGRAKSFLRQDALGVISQTKQAGYFTVRSVRVGGIKLRYPRTGSIVSRNISIINCGYRLFFRDSALICTTSPITAHRRLRGFVYFGLC